MSKYQALIDALKAEPTDGKWRKSKIAEVMIGTRRLCNVTAAESLPIGKDVERANINAAYIAAANPATIRALLADLERAEKAIEKIAALGGEWGPFPETKPEWAAIAIVTARETFAALSQLKGVQ